MSFQSIIDSALTRWFLTGDTPLSLAVPFGYDWVLVALSYGIATFSAFTALQLMSRVRASGQSSRRAVWLAASGIAMGVGIWAMHFIAMLAMHISVPLEFDILLTALSGAFAIVTSALAFTVAARDDLRLPRLALAGLILGGGVGLMHYAGMHALRMQAHILYDPWLFALSIVAAVVLATAALAIITYVKDPSGEVPLIFLVAGSAAMGLAIVSMHYTGMFATYFFPATHLHVAGVEFDAHEMAPAVGFVSLTLLGSFLIAALVDRRSSGLLASLAEAQAIGRVGSWELDQKSKHLVWSEEAFRIYGLDKNKFVPSIEAFYAHVHPDDRAAVEKSYERSVAQHADISIDHRIIKGDGNFRHVHESGRTFYDTVGRPVRSVGTIQDITEQKEASTALQARLERKETQMRVVGELARAPAILQGHVEELARELTEKAARASGCERVNVWLFNDAESELRCIDLYEATPDRHSAGMILRESEYGPEIRVLKRDKYVDADDPLTDPRTAGYVETYLKPLRITAMLDVTIQVAGRNLGLLCFEHVDRPHHWESDEVTFASQLADKIGLCLMGRQRREAEEAIRQSEVRFRTIYNSVSDAIFVHDIRTGTVLDVNERAVEMLGYSREVLLAGGMGMISTGVHPYTQAEAVSRVRGAATGHGQRFEWHYKARDGRVFWSEVSLRRGQFGNEDVVLATVRDISERKRADQELQFANTLLRTETEASLDAILVVDGNGKIVSYNRRFIEMWRLSPAIVEARIDEPLLATVMSQIRDPEAFRARVRHLYEHPEESGEDDIATTDGRSIERYSTALKTPAGEYLGRVWFFRDVTEREKAQAALQDSKRLIERILYAIPVRVFWKDRNLVYLGCNLAFARDAGFSDPKDVVGKDDFQMGWRDQAELYRKDDREVIESGKDRLFYEEPLTTPVGEKHTLVTSKVPLRNQSGEIEGLLGSFLDITDRKQAEAALRASEERFRAIFESVNDGIAILDPDTGRFLDVNQRLADIVGRPRAAFMDVGLEVVTSDLPPYRLQDAMEHMRKVREEGFAIFEWWQKRGDGQDLWLEVSMRRAPIGGKDYALAAVRDITERKKASAAVIHAARFDNLTDLANRAVFVEGLEQAIARARRGGRTFAVLYLDLDHFKDVNDTLGHPAGDTLLRAVAARLRSTARTVDLVARFGGDEFAVLATELQDSADASIIADKILKELARPHMIEGHEVRCGASIGIAVDEPGIAESEILLSHADLALYKAKKEGRGTFRFFTETLDVEVRSRLTVAGELREALVKGQLFLEYQPQVEIDSGRIVGAEALMRWHHPIRGLLGPSSFIHVAEASGLIGALSNWALRSVCRQAKMWLDADIPAVPCAVNLSAIQFKAPQDLERNINSALEETGLPTHLLEIELTETALMETATAHASFLARLSERGVRLAIDDFGTGYSSLSYLRRYPVARIKIAQEFIADIATDANSAAIVKASISLAHDLNIEIIAEGVETAGQLALLRDWGCHQVQGYYFSVPVSADAMAGLLRGGTIDPGYSHFAGLPSRTEPRA